MNVRYVRMCVMYVCVLCMQFMYGMYVRYVCKLCRYFYMLMYVRHVRMYIC